MLQFPDETVYLSTFKLPKLEGEYKDYPYNVIAPKQITRMGFSPITIFTGITEAENLRY